MNETVKTSRGVTVTCLPIQTLLDKLNAQYQPPEPPFYEVKTATGAIEQHAHDVTTLDTDADKAAWADYQKRKGEAESERNKALTRLVLLRGICVEIPEGETWVKEQEYLGIRIPEEPIERKLHYIETEVLGGIGDVEAIMLGVMRASGVPEDLLQQMESTFRRAVGKLNGDETSRPAPTANGTGMVLQPAVRASQGGNQNGANGQPVRRPRRKR